MVFLSFIQLFVNLGDFGGTMGLYIGASFLTLYELLDTVLFHFLTKTTKKQIVVGHSYWYISYDIGRKLA